MQQYCPMTKTPKDTREHSNLFRGQEWICLATCIVSSTTYSKLEIIFHTNYRTWQLFTAFFPHQIKSYSSLFIYSTLFQPHPHSHNFILFYYFHYISSIPIQFECNIFCPKNMSTFLSFTSSNCAQLFIFILFLANNTQCHVSSEHHNHYTYHNPKLPPPPTTTNTDHTGIKRGGGEAFTSSKRFEGSSNLVDLKYHMGPVLSSPINIYLIWYGKWAPSQQLLIKDFLLSISSPNHHHTIPSPSVSEWWHTVSYYTDQTGANISRSVLIAGEYSDTKYSHGTYLTRLTIQQVIISAVRSKPFPIDHKNGIYLILTSKDVSMQDYCRAVCGFHYFTFPSMVGYTLPYAWVGNSEKQCPEVCAYPFAVPGYMKGGPGALRPPNGDAGIDGMISVIAHELAEVSSNPLVNAWYAGEDPTAPTEIGDLCEGLYGSGGGGGYIGQVMKDGSGRSFNMNGRRGRKFLVQWIWSPVLKACAGPNALD